MELEVAQVRLSDLRALDTLRANKCALLRFHDGWYAVPATACLFVSSLHDRGSFASSIDEIYIESSILFSMYVLVVTTRIEFFYRKQ